mmetsp:Transcript_24775/g.81062  ORF Transcript_24775/g.81062 Transcript_24775/m.81062 type:complete len:200 (-) Transcript_24775:9-608(-)
MFHMEALAPTRLRRSLLQEASVAVEKGDLGLPPLRRQRLPHSGPRLARLRLAQPRRRARRTACVPGGARVPDSLQLVARRRALRVPHQHLLRPTRGLVRRGAAAPALRQRVAALAVPPHPPAGRLGRHLPTHQPRHHGLPARPPRLRKQADQRRVAEGRLQPQRPAEDGAVRQRDVLRLGHLLRRRDCSRRSGGEGVPH